MKYLDIIWNDVDPIKINLNENFFSTLIYNKFKYLQHVNLNFIEHPRDNPYSDENQLVELRVERLKHFAKRLGILIPDFLDQKSLNKLHKIYEQNYNGEPSWLEFHESIHMIEDSLYNDTVNASTVTFDYREKAGLVIEKFNRSWLKFSTVKVTRGTCYIRWQELGKSPYRYYTDNEPNNVDRLCELAKPWVHLKPNIFVSLTDKDFTDNVDFDSFNRWFLTFKDTWKSHWNVNNWTPIEQFSVIPIGYIDDVDLLEMRFKSKIFPKRIKQQ